MVSKTNIEKEYPLVGYYNFDGDVLALRKNDDYGIATPSGVTSKYEYKFLTNKRKQKEIWTLLDVDKFRRIKKTGCITQITEGDAFLEII